MRKLKKLFALLFTMLLAISFVGCTEIKKDPFKEFLTQMETEENCKMEMVMEIPVFGTVRATAEVDGNKMHMSSFLFVGETYTEIVDGVTYVYSKNESDQWVKQVQEENAEESEFATVDQLKYEDFTKSEENEKLYNLNSDKLESYGVKKLSVELTDTGIIMRMEQETEGIVMEITIIISEIGNIEVVLPEVASSTGTL